MTQERIVTRRDVLRGALAMGCSVLIPAALPGCNSKPSEKPASDAPAELPAASVQPVVPAEPESSGKASQASVQYQARPKGARKCSDCMHFNAESNTCNVVDGQISPNGWCTLWVKKA